MALFSMRFSGLPLEAVSSLDDYHRSLLHTLSISTVEELLATIDAAPDAMATFMDDTDLAQLQADIGAEASSAVLAVAEADAITPDLLMSLGAEPPPNAVVEPIALIETFFEIFNEIGRALGGLEGPQNQEDQEEINLIHRFGPIRDQGRRGTCVGHAGAAVLEAAYHTLEGVVANFSPQFLFYNSKMRDGRPTTDGTLSSFALPTLLDLGLCTEDAWIYEPEPRVGDVHHGPPPGAAITAALKNRATRILELDPRDSDGIRRQLREGRVATISVPVYENWYNKITQAYGKIPMPLPASRMRGGHALGAVGYGFDEEFTGGGYFIVRNSWGAGWALRSPFGPGYGAIPFAYIDRYGWEAFTLELGSP